MLVTFTNDLSIKRTYKVKDWWGMQKNDIFSG